MAPDPTPASSVAIGDLEPALQRYHRQILESHVGIGGQKRLRYSRAVLVGCGALGSALANTLARAGVGALRLIDRDYVELHNLQRQSLFDEHDVSAALPKAEAAARKLRRVNSAIEVDAVVADVRAQTIAEHCRDADILLDGADNFETRFLLNDFAVQQAVPWVYGACIGSEGLVMAVRPGRTACLRCVWDEPPPPGMSPTCDTAGILGPTVEIVAGFQALEAMKILMGLPDEALAGLLAIDAWSGRVRTLHTADPAQRAACVCCGQKRFEYLDGTRAGGAVTLCGRNAVQVQPTSAAAEVDLRAIADRLRGARAMCNEFLLRFQVDGLEFAVFRDGRAIVSGTSDPAKARAAYAKYVGG